MHTENNDTHLITLREWNELGPKEWLQRITPSSGWPSAFRARVLSEMRKRLTSNLNCYDVLEHMRDQLSARDWISLAAAMTRYSTPYQDMRDLVRSATAIAAPHLAIARYQMAIFCRDDRQSTESGHELAHAQRRERDWLELVTETPVENPTQWIAGPSHLLVALADAYNDDTFLAYLRDQSPVRTAPYERTLTEECCRGYARRVARGELPEIDCPYRPACLSAGRPTKS